MIKKVSGILFQTIGFCLLPVSMLSGASMVIAKGDHIEGSADKFKASLDFLYLEEFGIWNWFLLVLAVFFFLMGTIMSASRTEKQRRIELEHEFYKDFYEAHVHSSNSSE